MTRKAICDTSLNPETGEEVITKYSQGNKKVASGWFYIPIIVFPKSSRHSAIWTFCPSTPPLLQLCVNLMVPDHHLGSPILLPLWVSPLPHCVLWGAGKWERVFKESATHSGLRIHFPRTCVSPRPIGTMEWSGQNHSFLFYEDDWNIVEYTNLKCQLDEILHMNIPM